MKRFAAFAFHDYEASGGWNDFKGRFRTVGEAEAMLFQMSRLPSPQRFETWQIVDLVREEVVLEGTWRQLRDLGLVV